VRKSENSLLIRERVVKARKIQEQRFIKLHNVYSNSQMNTKMMQEFCQLDDASMQLIKIAMNKLGLSARAYDRILKVARTIADLANSNSICSEHIAEAIQYRSLDRDGWAG
jgi:magnesium chelatase family protein